jgi:outer membrane protein OmpA-like peptidoglycan-associated protein
MKSKSILIIFISLVLSVSCVAQNRGNYATKSKKAIKLFNNALDFYKVGKTGYTIQYLNRALEKDSNFLDAYLLLGDVYADLGNTKKALWNYGKVMEKNPDYYPKVYYMAAMLEMKNMEYRSAAAHLRSYLQSSGFDERLKKKVMHDIDICDLSAELVENPVSFDPKNLGENVNSADNEFVNAVNTENDLVVFTVSHRVKNQKAQEDFYISRRDNTGEWGQRNKLGNNFNTISNEGAMAISPDGKLIVFTSDREGGYGRFDLYYSVKKAGKWTKPRNMGKGVNTEAWDSQPTISSDGKTIYFVSDRRGGFGGSDIWMVTRQSDGSYGNPVNLGPEINTSGNEMTPFIHQDDHTLYFVSEGHPGLGGFDVFYARKNKDGLFANPVNIGYPINSVKNEKGLVVDAKGILAYISSDKYGGFGGYDIFSFELYDNARPIPVTYLKGVVYDKETNKKLKVDFDLIDLETGLIWIHSTSDAVTGEFLLCIPQGKNFALNAYRDGYLFYSDNFKIESLQPVDKPYLKNVPMTPVKVGESIVLENIFFESGSYELLPESTVELEKLYDFLIKNPTLKVEISGHTDNVGSDADNLVLSDNRARAVFNYLVKKGIGSSRLSFKGYGETKPVASNNTEEGRAKNRRTEIKITGI